MKPIEHDDNKKVINLIEERMALGLERYGHGMRAEDDTRQYGTQDDSWVEMALEEALDHIIYLSAALIRIKNQK
tara:strand:+ start:18820 stop:19041 length:222 start_codon:yes stop_codon:yes gene_type:complete